MPPSPSLPSTSNLLEAASSGGRSFSASGTAGVPPGRTVFDVWGAATRSWPTKESGGCSATFCRHCGYLVRCSWMAYRTPADNLPRPKSLNCCADGQRMRTSGMMGLLGVFSIAEECLGRTGTPLMGQCTRQGDSCDRAELIRECANWPILSENPQKVLTMGKILTVTEFGARSGTNFGLRRLDAAFFLCAARALRCLCFPCAGSSQGERKRRRVAAVQSARRR
jgi:hypothetical protein